MTFNIHAGIGTDGLYDLERVAALVREQQPDLLGLQEVDRGWDGRSSFDDQPARLAELTGMLPCYGPTIALDARGTAAGEGSPVDDAKDADGPGARPRREYGNLILSRLPITMQRHTGATSTASASC